jgi:hypothetical protein
MNLWDYQGDFSFSGLVTPAEPAVPPNARQAMSMIEEWMISQNHTLPSTSENLDSISWCSAPPDPRIYDLDVLNIWIDCAVRNLASTFVSFADFEVDEVYIAMAAIGGVYCEVRDSFQLAQVLYNDSRRLLLAKVGDL